MKDLYSLRSLFEISLNGASRVWKCLSQHCQLWGGRKDTLFTSRWGTLERRVTGTHLHTPRNREFRRGKFRLHFVNTSSRALWSDGERERVGEREGERERRKPWNRLTFHIWLAREYECEFLIQNLATLPLTSRRGMKSCQPAWVKWNEIGGLNRLPKLTEWLVAAVRARSGREFFAPLQRYAAENR